MGQRPRAGSGLTHKVGAHELIGERPEHLGRDIVKVSEPGPIGTLPRS